MSYPFSFNFKKSGLSASSEDQIKSLATTTNEIRSMEGRVRDTLSEYRNEVKQELGQLLQQLNRLAN